MTNEIAIQSLGPGLPGNKEMQEQWFFHELIHHILHQMNHKLRSDEAFVNLFASLLHQALSTAMYDEGEEQEASDA
jgi:hypothetical protein